MKNTMYKVLCAMLVCVMLLGMLPMTALATEAQTELTAVKAWNLVLADEIAVNFHVSIADACEDAVMKITDGYGTAEYPVAEAKRNADGTYLFTARLAAAQMADNITLQLIDCEQEGPVHTYSATQYAAAVLTGEYKQSAKDLVLAMINYGAAAQNYFGYNTGNLANAGFEAAPTAEIPAVSGSKTIGRVNGISLAGNSLLMQSRTAVRFYFNVSGDIAGYTFTVNGASCAPVAKDGRYYVDVPGINPQDYDQEIALEVTDGNKTMTVSYSPLAYISRQYAKSTNKTLVALVHNLYQYHVAAEAYLVDGGSSDVTTDGNGIVTEQVIISGENSTAVVATGTQLEENTTSLTLSVTPVDGSAADVELAENEKLVSMDVHVGGIAKGNTVPVLVTLNELAPEFLNKGNIQLYHVENGETVEMTRVYAAAELDAHNEYYYDIATGTVTIAVASFSTFAVKANNVNTWQGERDYTWYNEESSELVIYNADQLAGLSAIVGGMDGQTQDNFAGKTVKLMADINIGDLDSENDKVFYPIGYYNNTGSYVKITGGSVTSGVSSFEGTFDGNGHTVKNFYQNTWEMFGDYNDGYSGTPNHYKDAMGLFGYVYNGTVKNLTVDNFSSDGEFTPTGVIAAYACNATFENIAITHCNPRVYNTGNGGIVGIGGNSGDPDTYKLTFTNITIDNTNVISALWGSWDVACGGLVGMFRGAGHAYMTNCHVAAQIDVYNDVCGNYQYYWYRYAGMMIGTNKNMVTDANGYTVPETSKYHAEGCTVHFGSWNDYYYCELVANSLASYTHDHQFSRLTQIGSLNEIYDGANWTKTGNFLLIDGDTKTCYHIVSKDGVLTRHNHEDAGTETVNGETVLKENNQIVYLPFNQLFTGYGWGVKHIPVYNGEDYAFEGITILDREVADSVVKFETVENVETTYWTGSEVQIGKLFKLKSDVKLDEDNVQVFVSPVGATSTAAATYVSAGNWTEGTLTFSGKGAAEIIITDYYFCEETRLEIYVDGYTVRYNDPTGITTVIYGEDGITELLEGSKVEGKEFYGWSDDQIDEATTSATIISEGFKPENHDIFLYAVYTYQEAGETKESWTKVTDVSNLAVGDQVVIVADGSNYALSTTQNGNNRGQAAVTKSGNTVTWTSAVQVLTLEAGNTAGTFAFQTGSGYLYAAGGTGKNNYLRTKTTLDATGSWNITITSEGVATIKTSDSTVARHTVMYNTSGLFSCYASGQQNVAIYEKISEATNVENFYITICYNCEHINKIADNKPATCTEAGYKAEICADCGIREVIEVLPIIEHNYVDGVCSMCGKEQSDYSLVTTLEQVTNGDYVIAVKVGDKYYAMDTSVTNNKVAAKEIIVNSNGELESEAPVWTVSISGTNVSLRTENSYLSHSGDNTNIALSATNCNWTISESDDGTFELAIGTRGILYRTGSYNVFGAYATSNIGKGEYYGNLYLFKAGSVEGCAHENATTVTTEATCTKEGSIVTTCPDCGYIESETIEKLPHNFVDGSCSVCGEAQIIIPEIPETGVYKLVTDMNEIKAGGKFVIAANVNGTYYAMDAYDAEKSAVTGKVVTVSGNYVTSEDAPTWIIGKFGENIALQGENGAYLHQSSKDDAPLSDSKTEAYAWAVLPVEGSTNSFYIVSAVEQNRGITYRTGEFDYFRSYALNNNAGGEYYHALKLYKLVEGEIEECQHTNTTTTTVDATCTTDGSITVICDDCGEVISEDVIEALGHNYDAGEITQAATCTVPGVKTFTCQNEGCESSYTEAIDVVDHTYEDGKCTACGAEDPNYSEPSEPKTITFELGANGSATHADGSSKTTYTATVDGYTLNITNGNNFYTGARDAKGNSCFKLGASSKTASFQFTVADEVNSVTIYVAGYKDKTVTVKVNGTSHKISATSNNGEYTAITIDTTTTKTITFATTSTGYRAMINSIAFVVPATKS